jgi:hypothetical protein
VDADVAGAADKIVHHRAVQDFEPARPLRLADHDLRRIVGLRVIDDVLGDLPMAGGQRNRLAAERFDQPQSVGDAIAFFVR